MGILDELKTESNGTYRELYASYYDDVKRFIIKHQGTAEDAEDIFQETMILLVEKLRRDNFAVTASLKTYIIAIAKYLWFRQYKNAKRQHTILPEAAANLYGDISAAVENEKTFWEKIQAAMTRITGHCNKLLHEMFFMGKKAGDIQKEYGYSSVHNAQNQKHKCISQIKKALEEEKKSRETGDNFR